MDSTTVKRLSFLFLASGSAISAASIEDGLALKQAGDLAGAEAVFSAFIAADPADPGNPQALAERATVRSWQQNYDEALIDWREALLLRPQEVGWQVGQCRTLFWKGDVDRALVAIDQAIAMRADDPESWELKGDIARAAGKSELAIAAYREADRLLPNGSAAAKLNLPVALAPTAWRIDAYALVDRYSTERGNEPGFSLTAGYRHLSSAEADLDWYVQGGAARLDHFDAIDVTYGAAAGVQVLTRLQIHAGGTLTPSADFEPDWRTFGGVEVRVAQPLTLLFDLTHSDYSDPQQEVLTALPGLRLVPLAWLTLEGRLSFTTDHLAGTTSTPAFTDRTHGWQARLACDVGRVHPYISFAQGNEPAPPLPPAQTKAVWGGVVYDLSRSLALRADVAYEDRLDTYHRITLGAGVSVRF